MPWLSRHYQSERLAYFDTDPKDSRSSNPSSTAPSPSKTASRKQNKVVRSLREREPSATWPNQPSHFLLKIPNQPALCPALQRPVDSHWLLSSNLSTGLRPKRTSSYVHHKNYWVDLSSGGVCRRLFCPEKADCGRAVVDPPSMELDGSHSNDPGHGAAPKLLADRKDNEP
jgi:hypothetical protein